MLWRHVAQMYYQDVENCRKLLPRLTFDHIDLNAYSKMRVNLAAQVLSASVAVCSGHLDFQKQKVQQSTAKWWMGFLIA